MMLARLRAGPTPLYAQLSMILRSKIMSGEWPANYEIPTLIELCEQYGVARVTARQAVQLLVAEGLLSSQRGRRTFVAVSTTTGASAPLFNSIGSLQSARPDYSIRIVAQVDDVELPETRLAGVAHGRYVRLCKIDCEDGEPYAYSENYVSRTLFSRLPKKALTTTKIARLIRDRWVVATADELTRVSLADFEEARHLNCSISAPVAQVERVFRDSGDHILYLGKFTYRGDRFAVEHDISGFFARSERS